MDSQGCKAFSRNSRLFRVCAGCVCLPVNRVPEGLKVPDIWSLLHSPQANAGPLEPLPQPFQSLVHCSGFYIPYLSSVLLSFLPVELQIHSPDPNHSLSGHHTALEHFLLYLFPTVLTFSFSSVFLPNLPSCFQSLPCQSNFSAISNFLFTEKPQTSPAGYKKTQKHNSPNSAVCLLPPLPTADTSKLHSSLNLPCVPLPCVLVMPGLVSRARPPGGGAGASLSPAVPTPLRWHGAGYSALRAAARHPRLLRAGLAPQGRRCPRNGRLLWMRRCPCLLPFTFNTTRCFYNISSVGTGAFNGWVKSFKLTFFAAFLSNYGASLVVQAVRNLPAMQENQVQSRVGRYPGEGNGNSL